LLSSELRIRSATAAWSWGRPASNRWNHRTTLGHQPVWRSRG